MKRAATVLFSTLLVTSTLLTTKANQDQTISKFWQEFKTAVSSRNVDAVARLTNFPLGMSYGIASVKSKVQLRKRYKEVFEEQSNAVTCFSKAQPEIDQQNPRRFTVACPDQAGNEVVVYWFSKTKVGWKFVGLDNLNE